MKLEICENDAALRVPLLDFREPTEYRDFLFLLVWREIHMRYRHTLIGLGWTFVNPLLTMLIFGLIVPDLISWDTLAAQTQGVPYAVYVFCGFGSLDGANGSGKSVLLKILARVTKPTAGRSIVRGSVSSILNLGAMLNPELTGRENIFHTGTILRSRRESIARRFDEIVEFCGIEAHLDSLVHGCSAGIQLRLAFAVMAHLECDILLIDEALSVGDQEFRERCVERIRQMGCARRIFDTYCEAFHGGHARAESVER